MIVCLLIAVIPIPCYLLLFFCLETKEKKQKKNSRLGKTAKNSLHSVVAKKAYYQMRLKAHHFYCSALGLYSAFSLRPLRSMNFLNALFAYAG